MGGDFNEHQKIFYTNIVDDIFEIDQTDLLLRLVRNGHSAVSG